MIFCNLGSGSKGNSSYIQDNGLAILVDQGFSLKNSLARMEQAGLVPEKVCAIILTHEHSDHLAGVGVFARRFHIPVYITSKTRKSVPEKILKNVRVVEFSSGDELIIAGMKIKTFHIPHDAADPIGLVISGEQHRIGLVTDIGNTGQYLKEHLNNLDILFLESNHDIKMLDNGPYPLWLITRIKSRFGHLSNEQSAEVLELLKPDGRLKHLILAHLSEQNNTPELVLNVFNNIIGKSLVSPQLHVATQHEPGQKITL